MNEATIIIIVIVVIAILFILFLSGGDNRRRVHASKKGHNIPWLRRKAKSGGGGSSSDSDSDGCKHLPKICGEEGQIPQISGGVVEWTDPPEDLPPPPCERFPQTCGQDGQVLQLNGGVPEWSEKCDCPSGPVSGAVSLGFLEYDDQGPGVPASSRPLWSNANIGIDDLTGFDNFSGLDVDASTGIFTAPSDGIYYINGFLTWSDPRRDQGALKPPVPGASATYLFVNGNLREYDEDLGSEIDQLLGSSQPIEATHYSKRQTQNISSMLSLQAGDQVHFKAFIDAGNNIFGPTYPQYAKFQFYKV